MANDFEPASVTELSELEANNMQKDINDSKESKFILNHSHKQILIC